MVANFTQPYYKAQEAYRQATTPEEVLAGLQWMLTEIPKHKASEKLQSELKQKISEAKKDVEKAKAAKKTGVGLKIPRQGAGRAVIIGGPNAGKSQLLKSLTRATPEVAPYPFTTREPQIGMMAFEDVNIQLIDTPPITKDYLDPNVLGLMRGADVILLMVDLGADEGIDQLQELLDRLKEGKTRLAKESYLDEEDLGVSYTHTLLLLNKIDAEGATDRLAILDEMIPLDLERFMISAETGQGLDALRERIYRALDVVRVYTKSPSKKEADYDKPYTIRRGGTLIEIAELVHKDLATNFKHARVWSTSLQGVSTLKGDYVVHDKDVVEIHTQ